jgi:hypothetical protein
VKRGRMAIGLGLALSLLPAGGAIAADGSSTAARRAPSSVTLAPSDDTIRFGTRVKLVATLTGPPPGQAILIERVGGEPTVIGGCITGDAGRCAVTVKPRRASTFRAVFAGAGSSDPSTSTPATVRVRADVDGKLRGFFDRAGRYRLYRRTDRVTFVVSVAPGGRGQQVWLPLEFNYGFGWKDGGTSSFRTEADGHVTVFFAPRSLPSGAYRIQGVTRAARGVLGGSSALAYFRVKG